MSIPRLVRALLAALYLAFFCWYTSCGGPLDREEIAHYADIMKQRGATAAELAALVAFLESDTGDDFVMVNLIETREPPIRLPGVGPDESSDDVMDRYMAYMWPALLSRACHPVLFGRAAAPALDVWGIANAEIWSQAGVMRYRSRRDLMEIATNPAFSGPHEFKIAAMRKTIAFPADPWFQLGDPRLVLGLAFAVVALVVRGRRA